MLIYKRISEIESQLNTLRGKGLTVGFIPTMGALHEGHISLIRNAAKENDTTVLSIFVNPTQFNNPEDLKNYPRDTERDLRLLENSGVKIVFIPETEEIYPNGAEEKASYNFGRIEEVMEGKFRLGHFKGVAQVVSRLFEIVKPNTAYFGEKDFQQLAVIRELVRQKSYPIQIIGCPTVREENGLAMSSRNERLTPDERKEAGKISKALFYIRDNWREISIEDAKAKAKSLIEQSGIMKIEYLEIVDEQTLESVSGWSVGSNRIRCFIAVQLEKVRLIDNVALNTTFAA